MINDFGDVLYPQSSINTGQEYIDLSFFYKGEIISISCQMLECGFTDRLEAMHFTHPHPPFSRFFIFVDGGARVKIDSETLQLVPGNVYHLPPNQPFDVTYGISKLIFFHLHVADISGQSLFANTKGIPRISDHNLLDRYLDGFANSDTMQTFSAIIDTVRIFLKPEMGFVVQRARQTRNFSLLFDYLQKKPVARVSVSELAELYSKTPDALSKHFKRVMGISLKNFLLERQLEQARKLLLFSRMPISRIADELGHSNSQYFHRFFKKHCSCTPREYRYKNSIEEKQD